MRALCVLGTQSTHSHSYAHSVVQSWSATSPRALLHGGATTWSGRRPAAVDAGAARRAAAARRPGSSPDVSGAAGRGRSCFRSARRRLRQGRRRGWRRSQSVDAAPCRRATGGDAARDALVGGPADDPAKLVAVAVAGGQRPEAAGALRRLRSYAAGSSPDELCAPAAHPAGSVGQSELCAARLAASRRGTECFPRLFGAAERFIGPSSRRRSARTRRANRGAGPCQGHRVGLPCRWGAPGVTQARVAGRGVPVQWHPVTLRCLHPSNLVGGVVLTPGGTSPRDLLLVFCPAAPKFSNCEPVRLLRFDSSQGPGAAVRQKSSK